MWYLWHTSHLSSAFSNSLSWLSTKQCVNSNTALYRSKYINLHPRMSISGFSLVWSFICGFSSSCISGDWYVVWQQIHKIRHSGTDLQFCHLRGLRLWQSLKHAVGSLKLLTFLSALPHVTSPHNFSSECYQLYRSLSQGPCSEMGCHDLYIGLGNSGLGREENIE